MRGLKGFFELLTVLMQFAIAASSHPRNSITWRMKMALLKLSVSCATLVLAANAVAQTQERIDMSKYTCEQMLAGSGDSIETAIWLSGYYNGLRKNTVLDTAKFSKNADLVIAECKASPKKTVMQTVNTLSRKK